MDYFHLLQLTAKPTVLVPCLFREETQSLILRVKRGIGVVVDHRYIRHFASFCWLESRSRIVGMCGIPSCDVIPFLLCLEAVEWMLQSRSTTMDSCTPHSLHK